MKILKKLSNTEAIHYIATNIYLSKSIKIILFEDRCFIFSNGPMLEIWGRWTASFLCIFFLKSFAIKINYEICNKELVAIIDAFKKWYHLLERA
jgi:hypothetical protein